MLPAERWHSTLGSTVPLPISSLATNVFKTSPW
ncbi:unnamed protein product [Linum tenue]|uniref:Uncharacterized protein n=1 Tax=Linum tenue TaxID=586396 RepID=A0AAV0MAM3_9ROSI|nr:unnamed protein product [Linum tenue]